jgi:hypothetical protein
MKFGILILVKCAIRYEEGGGSCLTFFVATNITELKII